MARKAAGRRCPACGADVATLHRFCTKCGAWLDPVQRTQGPSAKLRWAARAFVALLALLLVAGLANRLFGHDDPDSTPLVEVAGNVDPRLTRTPAPSTRTSVPPTRTPVPPLPTATEHPQPTQTPKPAPSRTPSPDPRIAPVFTQLAVVETTLVAKPPKAIEVFAPTETSIPDNPSRIPAAAAIPTKAVGLPTQTVRSLASTDCSRYDAWEWAQSVYESDPAAYAGLDPDGNGTACDGLGHGFAPAFWTTGLPDRIEIGTVAYLVDGDTYEIVVDGQSSRYRLYHADTPETYDAAQCGGAAATDFVRYVLQFSDTPQQVWIESVGQRDPYGRKLAYIWITIGGDPYLLNHVLINNGWAEDIDYNDDFDPYKSELRAAANFAERHTLGVWAQCGGFGIALDQPTSISTTVAVIQQPSQQVHAQLSLAGNCDPNYTPCVSNVSYDLDCKDIGFRVQVIGHDRHRFDADGDGAGCESW